MNIEGMGITVKIYYLMQILNGMRIQISKYEKIIYNSVFIV